MSYNDVPMMELEERLRLEGVECNRLRDENAALREEVKALKANQWAAFTDDEILCQSEMFGEAEPPEGLEDIATDLHNQATDELARREGSHE